MKILGISIEHQRIRDLSSCRPRAVSQDAPCSQISVIGVLVSNFEVQHTPKRGVYSDMAVQTLKGLTSVIITEFFDTYSNSAMPPARCACDRT